MQPAQKRLEVSGDDDLAVQCEPSGGQCPERADQLGEVARERSLVAAAQVDFLAVAEDQAPEPVPFRLVEVSPPRELSLEAGEHRRQRRSHGERHALLVPARSPPKLWRWQSSRTRASRARSRRKARGRCFRTATTSRSLPFAPSSNPSRSGALAGASCRWTTPRRAASTRRTTFSCVTACTSSGRRSCASTTRCSRYRAPPWTKCAR